MATTRGERLRMAREKRFKSARLAGKALGIPVSTYGAHERAQSPGGRDYGPEDAKKYARRFGVTPEWLLTGREPFPTGADESPAAPKVPVVGYVGAGSAAHLYDVAQPDLDEVGGPADCFFNLHATTEKPIADVKIEWAARVNSISRRS